MNTHYESPNPNYGYLDPANFDEIEANMLYGGVTVASLYGNVRQPLSFTHYMREYEPLNPDVMVFTAFSAVPLADSVRGYYDERGQQPPQLISIRANSYLSDPHNMKEDGRFVQKRIDDEVNRLQQEITGTKVVVFDQHIGSGRTIQLAENMLQRAGVVVMGKTDEACWYEHTRKNEVNKKKMTSDYADFMSSVGRLASQLPE